jgi:hypothetical protein
MNTLSRFWYWATKNLRRQARPTSLYCLLNYTWVAQALCAAVELNVADHLDSGAKTVEELASLTGSQPPLLEQVMRCLAGFGVFALDRNGRYRNRASSPLMPIRAPWFRAYVLFWKYHLYPSAGAMLEMVRTGRSAFAVAHGKPPYEWYTGDAQQARIFDDFMSLVTDWQNPAIVASFDFRPFAHVLDVGGGRASFISAILKANPHLKGTIFDQPHMAQSATERLGQEGLLDRCEFVGGNFFESVPTGADLYAIKHVLPDWPDADAVKILANVAKAMSPDSLLLIVDGIMDRRNGRDQLLKMRDLEEMIYTGGRMRTKNDFLNILEAAGLKWVRSLPSAIPDCELIYVRRQSP